MSTVTTHPRSEAAPLAQDDPTSLMPKKLARARPLFDPEIVRPRDSGVVRQAESGHADEESGDVRGRSRAPR